MVVSEQSRNALVTHLHNLTERQLADLAAARRDLTLEPLPATLTQLAGHMLTRESLAVAIASSARPGLQVGEAVAALGDGWTVARLAGLIGVREDDAALSEAVAGLSAVALIWPVGGGFAADHLEAVWPEPLGLGPRAADLLAGATVPQARRLAERFGVAAGRRKHDVVAAVAGWLGDPGHVRAVAAGASTEDHRRLREVAEQPGLAMTHIYSGAGVVRDLPWAVEHGLLIPSGWGGGGRMPREVALALRGEDYRAPFDGEPPAAPTTPVSAAAVARDAAAAANETLSAVAALMETIGRSPVGLLKTGGLGLRELRRLAKEVRLDEDRARLSVEVVTAGGLTSADEDGLAVGPVYGEFTALEPGAKLVDLVASWLQMPACPLAPPRPGEPAERALYWDPEEEAILIGLRTALLRVTGGLTEDGRAITRDGLAARFAWRHPVLAETAGDDYERFVTGIWREAHAIGLLAQGAPTALGRHLLAAEPEETHRAAAAMVAGERATVMLQNDLTAVATGTPSASLLALLGGVADAESRGGAWTWRFSAASVRRAFDDGARADELIERLASVAEGGRLPQALSYLIGDVARRHGRVRVQPAACCLCSDDEALLTEILHTRSLRSLKLTQLAPTVLSSVKPEAETLAALRAAGFAPAGTGSIERVTRPRRPEPVEASEPEGWTDDLRLVEPAEFAARLVSGA
ncbi:helicase-associated domain-containing protein [Actinoplanes sp. HUAS TT8]|uniref:helicase-associated domain-containing protein n=1 Tax=Actinoplanes sp. HUAS TT8 TaxID=3447453 RepID=UPI003F51F1D9